jgi:adenine-specific DNA-methyltransferase
MAQKLELKWIGKDERIAVENRILIENKLLSHKADGSSLFEEGFDDNLLIHGDNLLALRSIKNDYHGKIKCIYIDPPYNTGSAFEHYDDNVEHSTWLSLMSERLKLLRNLLTTDGCIFIQIDYNEQAYLKVLCDEIFGRGNFVTMITCKVKAPSGIASGTNAFFDCSEYILVYAKSKIDFVFNPIKVDSAVIGPKSPTVTNVYNQNILKWVDDFHDFSTFEDVEIKEMNMDGFECVTIPRSERTEETYYKQYQNVFRIAAISGGRDLKILAHVKSLPNYDKNKIYSYSYVASQGKNKGKRITNYIYKGGNILFLRDFVRVDDEKRQVFKQDIITNIFYNDWWQGLTNEGGVDFKNGQKPEKLIETLLKVVTKEGDIVLDSFLGSGTTCAAAHKMRRRWIGIEMGDHAYTHCKKRLDSVVDGLDPTGITRSQEWNKGGGYHFYELAPTLINSDSFGEPIINKEYNGDMLAAAVALHEGFKYMPDEKIFWKQSKSNENAYLFVTTAHVTVNIIKEIESQMAEGEYLVVACKSFEKQASSISERIKIKKIPQMLLGKCEFGKNNYNLNIVNPPVYEDEEENVDE